MKEQKKVSAWDVSQAMNGLDEDLLLETEAFLEAAEAQPAPVRRIPILRWVRTGAAAVIGLFLLGVVHFTLLQPKGSAAQPAASFAGVPSGKVANDDQMMPEAAAETAAATLASNQVKQTQAPATQAPATEAPAQAQPAEQPLAGGYSGSVAGAEEDFVWGERTYRLSVASEGENLVWYLVPDQSADTEELLSAAENWAFQNSSMLAALPGEGLPEGVETEAEEPTEASEDTSADSAAQTEAEAHADAVMLITNRQGDVLEIRTGMQP